MQQIPIHPVYFAFSMLLLSFVADLIRRVVPFYRRELEVEEVARLTPLDGLRGLLCFGVMYYHAAITQGIINDTGWQNPPSAFCVLLGQLSVALFFSTTGFLFWSRAIARKGDVPAWPFWRGRFFRIVPLYLFACLLVLLMARRQIDWHSRETYTSLAPISFMGMVNWKPLPRVDLSAYNAGVVWTLQFEWLFYLALPALAPMLRDRGGWKIILVFLAVKRLGGWNSSPGMTLFFLPGIFAAHIAQWPRVTAVLRRYYISGVVLLLVSAMPFMTASGYGWLGLLMTTLIFIPIACGNTLLGLLNWSGLRLMGVVSYSVYLLHPMFLFESRGWLATHGRTYTQYWSGILGLACVVLLACTVTYRVIEWPAIQFERRFRLPR